MLSPINSPENTKDATLRNNIYKRIINKFASSFPTMGLIFIIAQISTVFIAAFQIKYEKKYDYIMNFSNDFNILFEKRTEYFTNLYYNDLDFSQKICGGEMFDRDFSSKLGDVIANLRTTISYIDSKKISILSKSFDSNHKSQIISALSTYQCTTIINEEIFRTIKHCYDKHNDSLDNKLTCLNFVVVPTQSCQKTTSARVVLTGDIESKILSSDGLNAARGVICDSEHKPAPATRKIQNFDIVFEEPHQKLIDLITDDQDYRNRINEIADKYDYSMWEFLWSFWEFVWPWK